MDDFNQPSNNAPTMGGESTAVPNSANLENQATINQGTIQTTSNQGGADTLPVQTQIPNAPIAQSIQSPGLQSGTAAQQPPPIPPSNSGVDTFGTVDDTQGSDSSKPFPKPVMAVMAIVILALLGFVVIGYVLLSGRDNESPDNNVTPTNTITPTATTTVSPTPIEVETQMRDVDELLTMNMIKLKTTGINASNDVSVDALPRGLAGSGDVGGIISSSVLYEDGVYKMWYTGAIKSDLNKRAIYYATSEDGRTWKKYDNSEPSATNTQSTNGRLAVGLTGSGDSANISNPFVLKDDEQYIMYYVATDGSQSPWAYSMFMATSPDGLTWTKVDNSNAPRTNGTSEEGHLTIGLPGSGDSGSIFDMSVIKVNGEYYMWYTGWDGTNTRIYMAGSSDGLNWTKVDNSTPVVSDNSTSNGRIGLGTSGKVDAKKSGEFDVYYDGTKFLMIYTGLSDVSGAKQQFTCAVSDDGYAWNKVNNSVGAGSTGIASLCSFPSSTASGAADINGVDHPNLLYDGGKLWLYYIGIGQNMERTLLIASEYN